MKPLLLSLILLVSTLLPLQSLLAAGEFSVTPAFQEIVLNAEESQEFEVMVTNDSPTLSTFRLSVLDFGSLDESGGVAFLGAPSDLEKRYSLASWMRPVTDMVTLSPGKTEKVKVTIENRPDLSPGGHYAALMFSNAENTEENAWNNRIAVNQIISVLVFVKKQGGEIYSMELVETKWSRNLFSFDEKLQLRFKNTGNVHLVPRGVVTLTDPLGRVVREGIINEESSLILPETFRQFPVKLLTQKKAFFPGRYRLTLAWRYEGKSEFTTVEEAFDFFPPLAILSTLPVIVGAGWYVARKRKKTGESASLSGTT